MNGRNYLIDSKVGKSCLLLGRIALVGCLFFVPLRTAQNAVALHHDQDVVFYSALWWAPVHEHGGRGFSAHDVFAGSDATLPDAWLVPNAYQTARNLSLRCSKADRNLTLVGLEVRLQV